MQSRSSPSLRALTLVELLVVVAIIGVLSALLLPLLGQLRGTMKRVVCANNLRQFGIAIPAFAVEHRGQVMETVKIQFSPETHYPYMIWELNSPTHPEQWSAENVLQYLPNVSETDLLESTGLWRCPASLWGRSNSYWGYTAEPVYGISYCYFGRVDRWSSEVVRPELLTGRRLSASSIIMSDMVYQWHVTRDYLLNHGDLPGEPGYSGQSHGPGKGPPLRGANQLWGDGRVQWKRRSDFPRAKLDNPDASIGRTGVGVSDFFFF